MEVKPDFGGYVTVHDVKCTDGRTIKPGAFAHQDKARVPLVWQHGHDSIDNVLGHIDLEARAFGMYGLAYLNATPQGKGAKERVEHGDLTHMSIWANQLAEQSKFVTHGMIREVSLVLAGANAEARIDYVNIQHSDGSIDTMDDEAVVHSGMAIELPEAGDLEHKTVGEIFLAMTDEQKNAVGVMLLQANGKLPLDDKLAQDALSHADDEDNDQSEDDESNHEKDDAGDSTDDENDDGGDKPAGDIQHSEGNDMTKNIFEGGAAGGNTGGATTLPKLSHAQLKQIGQDAEKYGGLEASFLAHAEEYGIGNLELLFPDAKAIDSLPELISRQQEWVTVVMQGVRKNPFSRIKSLHGDITQDEARAKGYVKGTYKKEEWFGLTTRETSPTTIYKKQKLDRDDILDITTIDVVVWLKAEMRLMWNEEAARAVLVGDGREVDDPDKVQDPMGSASTKGIRSIAHDDEFYAPKVTIPVGADTETLVDAIVRARKNYKGIGNPIMFCTEDMLADLLLSRDNDRRRFYNTQAELESALRVSRIVEVPVMEGQTVDGGSILAILVNLSDYSVGTDPGGELNFFSDFDIDFNQEKYLYEGRMSGALTKNRTALVFVRGAGTRVDHTTSNFTPSMNPTTYVVTIPTKAGVVFINDDTKAVLAAGAQPALTPGQRLEVRATPADGYYIDEGVDTTTSFTRPTA